MFPTSWALSDLLREMCVTLYLRLREELRRFLKRKAEVSISYQIVFFPILCVHERVSNYGTYYYHSSVFIRVGEVEGGGFLMWPII